MNTKKIAGLGVLTAIVIVLQAFAGSITFGVFSISLVLAPIVIGAALYGPLAGAWLGLVFGGVVLLNNSSFFLAVSVPGTIITVLLKGIACGTAAGVVYFLLAKKNTLLATIAAAVVAPVVNTGIFLIGCKLFFMSLIGEWAAAAGYESAGAYMILGIAGVNFLVEMGINLILSSAIVRIVKIARKE